MEFAKITSGGNVSAYPYSEAELRAANPRTSFPADLSTADLSSFKVVQVLPTEKPEAALGEKIVTTAVLDAETGAWQQSHTVKALTGAAKVTGLAIAKADLRAAVNARLGDVFQAGYTPADGPMAGHTLQVRDSDDRTNWLTSQAAYAAAVAGGAGDVVGANFRTAANATVTLTFAEGLSVLLSMAAWGAEAMGNSWVLKDAIEAAADFPALSAIDITSGWPA